MSDRTKELLEAILNKRSTDVADSPFSGENIQSGLDALENDYQSLRRVRPDFKYTASQDPAIRAIAMKESSGGKQMIHDPQKRTPWNVAFGPYGIKPLLGYEIVQQELKNKYPELAADKAKFMERFTRDGQLHNDLIEARFGKLQRKYGNLDDAAAAWFQGERGAQTEDPKKRAEIAAYQAAVRKFLGGS